MFCRSLCVLGLIRREFRLWQIYPGPTTDGMRRTGCSSQRTERSCIPARYPIGCTRSAIRRDCRTERCTRYATPISRCRSHRRTAGNSRRTSRPRTNQHHNRQIQPLLKKLGQNGSRKDRGTVRLRCKNGAKIIAIFARYLLLNKNML